MALSVRQLNALACLDPDLRRLFQGVYPSNRLPDHPSKTTIVNTDPAGEPGQHWLGVWRENQVCEVFGGLPLTVYEAPGFHEWITRPWKYVVRSDRTLQLSVQQPGLWPLCLPLLARTIARADPVGVCGGVSGRRLRLKRSSRGETRTSVDSVSSSGCPKRTRWCLRATLCLDVVCFRH